ncbi:hypothetical protein [Escherichia coli]|uniref:hypothetical protein n=1 Tax=Escherichia coli TaxID=562 RepID=UPI000CFC8C25|nr:hypothetical protein [Escherichia coli]UDW09836.1 hypothetical protein [Escherichia phage 18-1-2]UJQ87298.1 hypothetical protein [Escherichia phage 24-2-1]UJQ87503.1 hypothetical protein [Escherichia phage 19-1-2]UOX40101.1 hypothetical protein [Escherichia phage vB_EcoM_TH18]
MLHVFKKEDFQREYDILCSFIPKGVYDLLSKLDVKIAGGAITSLFSNSKVNDLDLYFPSWENLEIFIAYMMDKNLLSGKYDLTAQTNGWENQKRTFRYFYNLDNGQDTHLCFTDPLSRCENFHLEEDDLPNLTRVGVTDKSVTLYFGQDPVLQCVAVDVFKTTEDIFSKVDFTINMGAFNFKDGVWEFDSNFLKHIAQRVLVVNHKTEYPIISLLRSEKYKSRGYTISKKETMKLAMAIASLQIESWESAKSHLSGMYGMKLSDIFDETKQFSLDSLVEFLDRLESCCQQVDKNVTPVQPLPFNDVSKVNMFSIFQRLRKATGRKYFTKLYGVCPAEVFYLMMPTKDKHHVGLHKEDIANNFPTLRLYVDEAEARGEYKILCENGEGDSYGFTIYQPGAVLLEVSVSDTSKIQYDISNFNSLCISENRKTTLKIENIIECDGDIS